MSFILDALRKSENDRQRNAAPGIADTPVRQRREKRSIWLPLVAVLLGINFSLLGVLWFINERPETLARPQEAAPPAPVLPEPAPPRPIADPAVSRELSAELELPAAPAATPPATAAARARAPQKPAATLIDVPTFAELSLDGSIALPPLNLELHVYSDEPAQRFVYINTTKYREGEQISEGPIVEEINPLGVILTHQSRRFLLTRE
jgi:general secretion pathway protein B